MDAQSRSNPAAVLGRGMTSMLLRRHPPPAKFSDNEIAALKDVVKAMTQALSQGEMSIDLSDDAAAPCELNAKGWPITHRRALEASGWLHSDPVLMVMDGDRGRRRW